MDTSYFANIKRIKNPLSICHYPPEWYNGNQFKLLAPTWEILSAYKAKEIDDVEYTKLYHEKVLGKLDPKLTMDLIIKAHSDDVTLLCYESPGKFCHRRLVAEWFEKSLLVSVPERINYDLSPFLNY